MWQAVECEPVVISWLVCKLTPSPRRRCGAHFPLSFGVEDASFNAVQLCLDLCMVHTRKKS
jgi:hypothetical protein